MPPDYQVRLLEMYYQIKKISQGQAINIPLNIKEKNKMTLNTMMKKLLDADTQTLVKAGYINGDLELTDAGKKSLLTIIFAANKAALVAEAQEAINELKK